MVRLCVVTVVVLPGPDELRGGDVRGRGVWSSDGTVFSCRVQAQCGGDKSSQVRVESSSVAAECREAARRTGEVRRGVAMAELGEVVLRLSPLRWRTVMEV